MNPHLDTPYVYLEMLPDGILLARYKPGIYIDLPAAKEIVASRLAFTEGNTVPVLLYIDGVATIDRKVRNYISSPEGVKALSAAAIIKDSPFAAMVANLFVSLNNPLKMPVRIFTKEGKAILWLRTFLPKDKQSPLSTTQPVTPFPSPFPGEQHQRTPGDTK